MNISDEEWSGYLEKTSHLWRRYAASEKQQRAMCEIIAGLPEKSTVVELGVCHGLTAGLFLLAGKKNNIFYYGLDDFSLEGNYSEVFKNLNKLDSYFNLIVTKTQEYPWSKTIDFLFIDAGHDEINVKADCEKWIPFVRSGGYVSFHDYLDCPDPSINPHWAVSVYGDLMTKGWKTIAYLDNQMIIKQKP